MNVNGERLRPITISVGQTAVAQRGKLEARILLVLQCLYALVAVAGTYVLAALATMLLWVVLGITCAGALFDGTCEPPLVILMYFGASSWAIFAVAVGSVVFARPEGPWVVWILGTLVAAWLGVQHTDHLGPAATAIIGGGTFTWLFVRHRRLKI